mmetsp:Transcript_46608/g.107645  ORF Transcript_46608/g.107645 Transcript_46608/m.107645 type:complete len:224 (-) Transcript_46608:76-747(-)
MLAPRCIPRRVASYAALVIGATAALVRQRAQAAVFRAAGTSGAGSAHLPRWRLRGRSRRVTRLVFGTDVLGGLARGVGAEGPSSSSLEALQALSSPLASWASEHAALLGTFALIVGWAAVDGPTNTSRAIFREALRTLAVIVLLGVATVTLYGELHEPGYTLAKVGSTAAVTGEFASNHGLELLVAGWLLGLVLLVPNVPLVLGALTLLTLAAPVAERWLGLS